MSHVQISPGSQSVTEEDDKKIVYALPKKKYNSKKLSYVLRIYNKDLHRWKYLVETWTERDKSVVKAKSL